MKKVSLTVLSVFIVASVFSALTAFNSPPAVVTLPVISPTQGEPIHITFNRNAGRTFTTGGAITSSGTWRMEVITTGKAFHCINTLISSAGTLVAISHCNNQTMNGVWQIISGTGIFEDIRGNGTLMMLSYGEEWEGSVR